MKMPSFEINAFAIILVSIFLLPTTRAKERCPGQFIIPGDTYAFFLVAEDFNSRPSNPAASVFPMETIFSMPGLARNTCQILCRPSTDKKSSNESNGGTPGVSQLLGALGGSLGPSVKRTVTGDPTFFIGYSSSTAIDPDKLQDEAREYALGNVRLLDQALTLSTSVDLQQNVSAGAKERFGHLVRVVVSENLSVSELQFQNVTFKKDREGRAFVGKDDQGKELRIVIPISCDRAD